MKKIVAILLLFGLTWATSLEAQRPEWLPAIRPTACTKYFCFSYRGPYGVDRIEMPSRSNSSQDIALLWLQDETVVAFVGVPEPSTCVPSDLQWTEGRDRSFKTSLCIPTNSSSSINHIGVAVKSKSLTIASRHINESDVCVWPYVFTEPRAISLGKAYCIPAIH
jgi:hypothetical protein